MRIIVDVLWMGKIIIKYGAFLEHDSDLSGQGGGKRRGVELKSKQNTHLLSIPLQRTRCISWVVVLQPITDYWHAQRFKPDGDKWTFPQLCPAQPKQGKNAVFWGFWDKLELCSFQRICSWSRSKWWDKQCWEQLATKYRRIAHRQVFIIPPIWPFSGALPAPLKRCRKPPRLSHIWHFCVGNVMKCHK